MNQPLSMPPVELPVSLEQLQQATESGRGIAHDTLLGLPAWVVTMIVLAPIIKLLWRYRALVTQLVLDFLRRL